MERPYHSPEQFDIDLDSIRIANVVVVPDRTAAEVFFAKIFPHFTECYVLALDDSHPREPKLRALLRDRLARDSSLAVVVFGSHLISSDLIKSDRVLVMDKILAESYAKGRLRQPVRRDLDEYSIVHLMTCFFDQWRFRYRTGSASASYRVTRDLDREAMGWILDLISPPRATLEARIESYTIEDHEELLFRLNRPEPR